MHVRKAQELGRTWFTPRSRTSMTAAFGPCVDQALLLYYGDIDRHLPLIRALHEACPFQAAVSLFELGPLPTARINEALGHGGESVA